MDARDTLCGAAPRRMTRLLKQAANLLALAAALPIAAAYFACRLACRGDGAFAGLSQGLSLLPGKLGTYYRRAVYRLVMLQMAGDAEICFGVLLATPSSRIGPRTYVGPYSILGDVTLQRDVLIASHVSIINGGLQHGISRCDHPIRDQDGQMPHVTIGEGSWIGERAVVMCDIGRHCVVGAGAVVTRPLPDYAVAMGVPARIVRFRDRPAAVVETSRASEQAVAMTIQGHD